jgi:hypothetical protein
MNIDKSWVFLAALGASAALGTAVAMNARRKYRQVKRNRETRQDIKSWENEGGNLAPVPATRSG